MKRKRTLSFFGDYDKDESEEVLYELDSKGLIVFLHTKSHFTKFTNLFENYLDKDDIENDKYVKVLDGQEVENTFIIIEI